MLARVIRDGLVEAYNEGAVAAATPDGEVVVFGRVGVVGKCWDGSPVAVQVGIMAALEGLGVVHETARRQLSDLATPEVRGGGRPVGRVEPALGSRP